MLVALKDLPDPLVGQDLSTAFGKGRQDQTYDEVIKGSLLMLVIGLGTNSPCTTYRRYPTLFLAAWPIGYVGDCFELYFFLRSMLYSRLAIESISS